ncbi:MAG: DtxR family transcriptional regulator [Planctomycetes bacterium]|nr:DtxR family transcriptional regulator [Planctomycetota bacterium]
MAEHPVLLLLGAALSVALALLFFRPRQGLVFRWIRLSRSGRQVLMEDALKHLHDCEYVGRTATLHSLSGALETSGHRAADLAAHLEAGGLVHTSDRGLELTSEGRRYALKVIRTHRLWERFLADRTGLSEKDWHREADLREHRLGPAEVARLARRLGDPRFDPHGDPIPTSRGEIPPRRGRPLPALAAGTAAVIVHVEDEPEAVYAQILAQGLHAGTRIRILDASAERIRLESDGEEQVLAPVVAANVWATPLPEDTEFTGPHERLSALKTGEAATIVGLARACRGLERRRLLDLGIRRGAAVTAELRAPGGNPTAYRVCGAMLALRREQAEQIQITRSPGGAKTS